MNILIIGCTRGIGLELLKQTLAAGHLVTALARTPDKITIRHENLCVVEGDIVDPLSVNKVMKGQDAVCITIGVPITFKPVSVFSVGTAIVIEAMKTHGVQRLICITGIGAGDSKGHGGFLYDKIFKPLLLKTIYEDKDLQEQHIEESDLDWVIVRPAGLTNGPKTGDYLILTHLEGITAKRISRADVAHFMVQELAQPDFSRRAVLLTY